MSNALAIASVTRLLKDLLNDALVNGDVSGDIGTDVIVSALPPDRVEASATDGRPPQLNLYLHRVTHNAALANSDEDHRNPHVQWRTSEASPSGLAYVDGALWAASLRGERLWRIPVTPGGVGDPEDFFVGDYGRIRTINVTPDGLLWVTTSNRDGRGDPAPEDDRILLVQP